MWVGSGWNWCIYPSPKVSTFTHLHGFLLLVLLPWFIEITFFLCANRINLFESKVKFWQASNHCKRFLQTATLAYANKTKKSIISQKLPSWDFWQISSSFLDQCKFAIPPLFNSPELLSSASDKANLLAENFYKNSILDDSGISLPVFPSRTILKLHNISVILTNNSQDG